MASDKDKARACPWGNVVEQVVCHMPTGNRKAWALDKLLPGQSRVSLERGGQRWTATLHAIEIAGPYPGAKGQVQLDIAGSDMMLLEGHLETIPYGPDRPTRLEFTIDTSLDNIEFFGDTEGRTD